MQNHPDFDFLAYYLNDLWYEVDIACVTSGSGFHKWAFRKKKILRNIVTVILSLKKNGITNSSQVSIGFTNPLFYKKWNKT